MNLQNAILVEKVYKLLYVWNLFSQKIVQVLERLKQLDFICILNLEAVLLSPLPIHVGYCTYRTQHNQAIIKILPPHTLPSAYNPILGRLIQLLTQSSQTFYFQRVKPLETQNNLV